MSQYSEKRYREILQELCPEDCTHSYCFFKYFLETQHPSARTLIQIKCLEKYKYIESEHENEDIGWEKAAEKWCSCGYAKAFADVYDENLTVKEIFKRVLEKVEK